MKGGYGMISGKSFVELVPGSHSSRTWRRTSIKEKDSGPFLGTWPRAGGLRNGTVYQRQPSAPLKDATAFSLRQHPILAGCGRLYPTLIKGDRSKADTIPVMLKRESFGWNMRHLAGYGLLPRIPKKTQEFVAQCTDLGRLIRVHPTFATWMMGWTPRSSEPRSKYLVMESSRRRRREPSKYCYPDSWSEIPNENP